MAQRNTPQRQRSNEQTYGGVGLLGNASRGTGSLEQTPCGATVHDDETRNSGTTRALLRAFRALTKAAETPVQLKRVNRRTGYKPPASRLTSWYGTLESRQGQSRK